MKLNIGVLSLLFVSMHSVLFASDGKKERMLPKISESSSYTTDENEKEFMDLIVINNSGYPIEAHAKSPDSGTKCTCITVANKSHSPAVSVHKDSKVIFIEGGLVVCLLKVDNAQEPKNFGLYTYERHEMCSGQKERLLQKLAYQKVVSLSVILNGYSGEMTSRTEGES